MACCSPTDVRRVSLCAIIFLVVLRVSIGWQFLYEGLWKQHAAHGTQPWTAAGYLKNAQGPFRATFRNMVDDPYEFDKLSLKKVQENWAQWLKQFEAHYKLDATQKGALTKLVSKQTEALKEIFESPAITHKTLGDIELYRRATDSYEAKLKQAKQNFQQVHMAKTWSEIEDQRKKLTAPINDLTDELQAGALNLLNLDTEAAVAFAYFAEDQAINTPLGLTAEQAEDRKWWQAVKEMQDARSAGSAVTQEELEMVARVYREHFDNNPTQKVETLLNYTTRTAARRVRQARDAGLLPDTSQGKKKA